MLTSYGLIFLQSLSLGALFWPNNTVGGAWIASLLCLTVAIAVLLWTSKHNRFGNFNIVPEIKEDCKLIQTGPYRFVRHPMYTSVMLIGLSAVLYGFVLWKIAVMAILIVVLYLKAKREEGLWCEKDSEYSLYRDKSKMFIPFIL